MPRRRPATTSISSIDGGSGGLPAKKSAKKKSASSTDSYSRVALSDRQSRQWSREQARRDNRSKTSASNDDWPWDPQTLEEAVEMLHAVNDRLTYVEADSVWWRSWWGRNEGLWRLLEDLKDELAMWLWRLRSSSMQYVWPRPYFYFGRADRR